VGAVGLELSSGTTTTISRTGNIVNIYRALDLIFQSSELGQRSIYIDVLSKCRGDLPGVTVRCRRPRVTDHERNVQRKLKQRRLAPVKTVPLI
jgi:hypothetical protein